MTGHHLGKLLCPIVLGASIGLAVVPAPDAGADPFFNSSEPGCDGSDPTVLWCDDFEDGYWYKTDADQGGAADPENDGWAGTIFAPSVVPSAAACGSAGAAGTNCAARKGCSSCSTDSGGGIHGAMAKHQLPGATATDELFFRYYYYSAPGSNWNHEKMIGLGYKGWSCNDWSFADVMFTDDKIGYDSPGDIGWKDQNLGNALTLQAGHWYYIEFQWKLNAPGVADGQYRMWMDDCGLDGRGCTGSGTLRSQFTNVVYRAAGNANGIGCVWMLNWSPDLSNGNTGPEYSSGDRRYDQIMAAKRRIGPMGTTGPAPAGPPSAPVLLQ